MSKPLPEISDNFTQDTPKSPDSHETNPFEIPDTVPDLHHSDSHSHVYFELEKEDHHSSYDTGEMEDGGSRDNVIARDGKEKKGKTDLKKRNSFIKSLGSIFNKASRHIDGSSPKGENHEKLNRSNSISGSETGLLGSTEPKLNSSKEPGSEEGQEDSSVSSPIRHDGAAELSNNEAASEVTKKHKHHDTHKKEPKETSKSRLTRKNDSMRSTVSLGNRGCQEGTGSPVPVNFLKSSQSTEVMTTDQSEYSEIFHKSTENQLTESEIEKLKARGFTDLGNGAVKADEAEPQEAEDEFDDVASESDGQNEDSLSWGSEFSEEEVYEDGQAPEVEAVEKDAAPVYEKPLPPKPVKSKGPPGLGFLSRSKSSPPEQPPDDDSMITTCLQVEINPVKHPPPVLPPAPEGLSEIERKRRLIVEQIIKSEQSYLESLERILKEYEKTVLEFIHNSKSRLKHVFAPMRDIISHHKMFQIEMSESARKWNEEDKIGDTFTASFSKTILVDAYSKYINNFPAAMEEIRTLRRNKSSFEEFLMKQEKQGADRLSIFGLMVKPVQRFPQFIMFLQDLIKYTPTNHHDRRPLQLALTELENVAYKLNERKRQSEQQFQAQQIVHKIVKQKVQHMLTALNLNPDTWRRFLRADMVELVNSDMSNMKSKKRRLILMNDLVLCVKVMTKEQSGFVIEKLGLRWMANLRDLELKETAITPEMLTEVKRESDKIDIISSRLEKPEDDPFHLYADLTEMLHDYSVLSQISGLMSTLKRSYAGHGLNEELIHEVSRDLQRMIQLKDEQLRLVNSCSIVLEDKSKSDKPVSYVIHTETASIKQDWCVDFLMAKLALDKCNKPAWDVTINSDDDICDIIPAQFMKHLLVDVPRSYTKIKCAVSIFLSPERSTFSVGVQHLWVCSSSPNLGQISVLSIQNSRPSLMESFKACNCEITAVEMVPGYGTLTVPEDYIFAEDTVWVSTAVNEILIFPLMSSDGVHRSSIAVLRTLAAVVSLKFVDERVFCGCNNGVMAVYSRHEKGNWESLTPANMEFGISLVKIHFVHEEDLYLSCGNKLILLDTGTLQLTAQHTLMTEQESAIDSVVKSGVGLWVAFHDSSVIKLFHIESMENLQELSVGNFLNRIRAGRSLAPALGTEIPCFQKKLWSLSGATENMVVTSLATSKGLLWIGTSSGIVLTLPLPRLSGGVPLYRGRPSVSLHAHKGPVKFLMPLSYSTSTMELNRGSSLRSYLRSRPSLRNLKREQTTELVEQNIPQVAEKSPEASASVVKIVDFDLSATVCWSDSVRSDTTPLLTDKEAQEIMAWEEKSGSTEQLNASSSPCETPKCSPTDRNLVSKNRNASRQKSFDESRFALRRNNRRITEADRRSKTLSFRSELEERIEQSEPSEAEEIRELEQLCDVLLEDNHERGEMTGDMNNAAISGVYLEGQIMGNILSPSSSSSSSQSPQAFWHMPSTTHQDPPPGSDTSVSPRDSVNHQTPSTSSSSASSFRDSESGLKAKTLDRNGGPRRQTMSRKASNNAVILLSGGDGYCDLDYSRNQAKTEGACVMLWIYKF